MLAVDQLMELPTGVVVCKQTVTGREFDKMTEKIRIIQNFEKNFFSRIQESAG